MSNKMKAVIFDIGGVVVMYDKELYGRIVGNFGHSRESFIAQTRWHYDMAQKGRITYKDYWKTAAKRTGLTPADADIAYTSIAEGLDKRAFDKQMAQLIKRIKCKKACLTNTIDEHYEHNRKAGVYDLFDVVVASNKVGMAKPYKNIYRHALKLLKVKPCEAVFIDDKEEFVKPAKELGMHAILFKNAKQLKRELQKLKVI